MQKTGNYYIKVDATF